MSQTIAPKKVAEWTESPRTWFPTLECGHQPYEYDGGLEDEKKEAVEKSGNTIDCYDCAREQDRIAELEKQLAELKAKAKK